MTRTEYKNALNRIQEKTTIKMRELAQRFAQENNPHKIGDIVEDSRNRVKIERISIAIVGSFPSCVYSGPLLKKKDGKPYKGGRLGTVYQSNMKKEEKEC